TWSASGTRFPSRAGASYSRGRTGSTCSARPRRSQPDRRSEYVADERLALGRSGLARRLRNRLERTVERLADPDGCGDEGRREHEAEHPEQAARTDRYDEHDERVEVECGAHRERLEEVLQQAVGEQDDDEHRDSDTRPLRAERDEDGERAGDER